MRVPTTSQPARPSPPHLGSMGSAGDSIAAPRDSRLATDRVTDAVTREMSQLASQLDISLVDIVDPCGLRDDEANEYRNRIAHYASLGSAGGDKLFSASEHPSSAIWVEAARAALAIALHPLYRADTVQTLGEGISPEIFRRPLFGDMSAAQVLITQAGTSTLKQRKARETLLAYQQFINTPVDEASRKYYQAVVDAAGVRTRAIGAVDMVVDHLDKANQERITIASLGCGAAGPVLRLASGLGSRVERIILADKDPMALAAGYSLAESEGLEDLVDLKLRDLTREPLTDYIEAKSVHVVDLLGLFEYIGNSPRRPLASLLLRQVREIVRPDGIIVFGNMLNSRPEQEFFDDVVGWPRLRQRSIAETLEIIQSAGCDLASVCVRVPRGEGVYALYAILGA